VNVLFPDPRQDLSAQENVMIRNSRRPFYLLVLFAAMIAMAIGSREARAIYGMDMGMGFFGGFNPAPSPTQFINSHALIRAGQASTAPGPLRINNHPDSAANRARNSGFSSHYGLDSRRSPAFEADRRVERAREARNNPTQPAAPSPPAAAVASRPIFPIGSFFDSSRKLAWPSDSPVADELQGKRDDSDQACLVVADKVVKYGASPITLVTFARDKLLVYGQPALQAIRNTSTPRIAENFHNFLLSLYDSLAQAANPPEVTGTTNSTP
jgi:hypothetical protein